MMAAVRLGNMLRMTSRMVGRQGTRSWGEGHCRRRLGSALLTDDAGLLQLHHMHRQQVAPLLLEVSSVGWRLFT